MLREQQKLFGFLHRIIYKDFKLFKIMTVLRGTNKLSDFTKSPHIGVFTCQTSLLTFPTTAIFIFYTHRILFGSALKNSCVLSIL